MPLVRLRWTVPDLDLRISEGYDLIRIERDTGTGYSVISPTSLHMPLVRNMVTYIWEDPGGDPAYDYRAVLYRSHAAGTARVTITDKEVVSYCTIEDIREQGYAATAISDDSCAKGIARATAMIDRVCCQWFVPKYRVLRIDGNDAKVMPLGLPIIALMGLEIDQESVDLDSVKVSNRHLTGNGREDDREAPRLEFTTSAWDDLGIQPLGSLGYFPRGEQNVVIRGLFGCTEQDPTAFAGETLVGGQIPLDYGRTPVEIRHAATLLAIYYAYPHASGRGARMSRADRVIEEKNRDHSYKLQPLPEGSVSSGPTGIAEIDAILLRYTAPDYVGVVG